VAFVVLGPIEDIMAQMAASVKRRSTLASTFAMAWIVMACRPVN
jgi:hypothetical protein